MTKCEACANNKCKGKYANRGYCQDPDNCTCTCLESEGASFAKGFFSIALGAAAVTAGVAATIATGGIAGVVIGGVAVGGGGSMITNPIVKKMSGERMKAGDYAKDVAVGAVIGVATGGIGAGGSVVAKGAGTVAQLGIKAGAGAAAGATGQLINSVANGEDVTLGTMAKGALCGAVGGGVGHFSGNLGNAAGRIAMQSGSAGATDIAVQVIETGEVDLKRVAVTMTSSAAVGTCAEAGRTVGMQTKGYANVASKMLIEEDFPNDPKKQEELADLVKKANSMKSSEIQKQEKLAQSDYMRKSEEATLTANLEQQKQALENFKQSSRAALERTEPAKRAAMSEYNAEQIKSMKGQIHETKTRIETLQRQPGPDIIQDKNSLHALSGDRLGQAAMDAGASSNHRGQERIVMDIERNGDSRRFVYAGHTPDHDYRLPDPNADPNANAGRIPGRYDQRPQPGPVVDPTRYLNELNGAKTQDCKKKKDEKED